MSKNSSQSCSGGTDYTTRGQYSLVDLCPGETVYTRESGPDEHKSPGNCELCQFMGGGRNDIMTTMTTVLHSIYNGGTNDTMTTVLHSIYMTVRILGSREGQVTPIFRRRVQ